MAGLQSVKIGNAGFESLPGAFCLVALHKLGDEMFRLNQRVCRVSWRNGQPFLEFGTVTKATTQTYYVNGEKKQSHGWDGTAAAAIAREYKSLFLDWDYHWSRYRPDDWTIEDTVRCVCQVRRLERRLTKRRKGNQS